MLDGLIDWFVANFGRPTLSAGVLAVIILMLCLQARLGLIVLVAGAGLALSYWRQIVAFFPVG